MSIAVAQPAARKPRRILVVAWLLAALTAVVLLNWKAIETFPRRFIPRNLGVVEGGMVYRAGQIHRDLLPSVIEDNQIATIVCITYDPGRPDFDAGEEIATKTGATRLVFPGLNGNGTGDWTKYIDAMAAMKQSVDAGKPVLVHCAAGSERTGIAVYLWQTLVRGKSVDEAWSEVRAFSHDPRDNPDLVPFLNEHLPAIAAGLVERGVIDKVPDPLPFMPVQH
jgi:protein tyrosine phosphatase (PTP) superfamily phosphohydrolase (DUF442 family)